MIQGSLVNSYLLSKSTIRSSSVKGSRQVRSNLKSNCVPNHTVRFNKENTNDEMKSTDEYSLQRKSEILTHNPSQEESEAEKYYKLGYEARKVNEFGTAIKFYTKAIEIESNYANCYYNRGFSYAKLNDHMNAIVDYKKFIELVPDNGCAYYNLGISFNRVKKYEEAIKSFTQAIAFIDDNADFYCNRGFSYRKKGDYDLAVKDFNEAIKLSSNHFKVLIER
jgi:tetratricopeptide (TPR) repeat protein